MDTLFDVVDALDVGDSSADEAGDAVGGVDAPDAADDGVFAVLAALGPADYDAENSAAAPARGYQRTKGVWTGALRRGEPKAQYMRECRDKLIEQRKTAKKEAAKAALEGAWNQERHRQGDKVLSETTSHFQPNRFDEASVLRTAYMQVGGNKCIRRASTGITGKCRVCVLLLLQAEAFRISGSKS